MVQNSITLLAVIPALAAFLYYQLYQWRFKKYAHIPNHLKSNLFIGHLGHIASEYKNVSSPQVHPGKQPSKKQEHFHPDRRSDYVLERVWKNAGSPEYLFLDNRPAQFPIALITSHEIAEQISRSTKVQPYSTTKSPTIQGGLGNLIGKFSILSEEGEAWKAIRKTFNPGFAPQHLYSLLPVILDKTYVFMDKLDALAKSGKATALEPYCTDVTFDIIGEVVTDIDCRAQDETTGGDDIVRNFRILIKEYANDDGLSFAWLNAPKVFKKYLYGKRLDAAIKKCITDKYQELQQTEPSQTKAKKDRSVLALALAATDELTPHALQSIADQVKTFLFAGHDTTSILLQRLFYILSVYPQCLAKIREEHDAIFGSSDPREVFVNNPDGTIKELKYTSACIKEALRLWPPAGTARMSHNGFRIRTSDGEEACLDEVVIYSCQHIIQRDPKVYGETANDFVPERWLGDTDTSMASADADGSGLDANKIPISAWRPFERGPRNCIGQELANIEARVILACTMRRYDFVKVGQGELDLGKDGKPVVDEKGKYKTKSELWSVSAFFLRECMGSSLLTLSTDYCDYSEANR